jgi:ATP-dependent Lon protease
MEIIHLPGYTEEEKLEIAKRYLVRRQLEANGLKADQVQMGDAVLATVIRDYTREAGVRNLEREIGSVLRHAAVKIAEGAPAPVRIDVPQLAEVLGPARFEAEVADRTAMPGVATGLAWTPVGGDIMFIEAIQMPGKGQITLTGQLGDVMKESAQAAWSLLRARAAALDIPATAFTETDVHLHVPAGAVPKDGPSAGITIATALASLLCRRPVRHEVAMTGELTLRGRVLPVGGLKEKLTAAARAGVTTVLVPARNRNDLLDLPEEVKRLLDIRPVETVDDVLALALLAPEPRAESAHARAPRRSGDYHTPEARP